VCGEMYTPTSGRQTTCSPECRLKRDTASQGRWHKLNPEKTRAAAEKHRKSPTRKRWAKVNRERVNEKTRLWREANKAGWSAYMEAWRKTHRENTRAHDSARRAQSKLSPEDRTISIEYRKAIANDPCYYCGRLEDMMEVDHYIPLAKGGTDHWWNLVHACADCNRRKHAMHGDDFLLLGAGL